MHIPLKLLPLLTTGVLFAASAANAQLVHHYNLTDGVDSVGGANGTLSGNATFAGGRLVTSGNDNTSYLGLPSSVGTGITGNFSIQVYTSTTNAGTGYSTLFSFASAESNFILLNANRPGLNATSVNFQQAPSTPGEINVAASSALLADGLQHDIVFTYAFASGAVSIYNNGAFAGSGNIGAGFSFQTASAGVFNGINGHAPFTNDNTYAGSTDDFRIYSQTLTASQVSALDAAGVNASNAQIAAAVPEPSTWVAMAAGILALCGVQRRRRSVA